MATEKKPATMYQARIVIDLTILTTRDNKDAAKKIIERLSILRTGWSQETGDYDLKAFADEILSFAPFDPNPYYRKTLPDGPVIAGEEEPVMEKGAGREPEPDRPGGSLDLF